MWKESLYEKYSCVKDYVNHYRSVLPILNLMAKRINPLAKDWFEFYGENVILGKYRCLICGNIIDEYAYGMHGINHLEESNLKSFL